jgi:hypothetical protein
VEERKRLKRRGIIDLVFIFIFTIFLVFMFGFVNAVTTIYFTNISNGSISAYGPIRYNNLTYIINEDVVYQFNLTINHTSTDSLENISQINISLFGNFVYVNSSNRTGLVSGGAFAPTVYFDNISNPDGYLSSGTTSILSWNRTGQRGYIINSTNGTAFMFNMSAPTPGKYNITVTILYNASGLLTSFTNQTNITIIVNDTTAPGNATFYGAINNPAITNYAVGNYSGNLLVNISTADNGGAIRSVFVNVTANTSNKGNGTTWFFKASNASTSPNYWNVTLDTYSFPDGYYNITVWVNDSNGNLNRTSVNVTIDNTAPTGTFSCSPDGLQVSETVTCTCTSADDVSGVDTSAIASGNTYTVHPSTDSPGTFTQECTFKDLAGNSRTLTSNSYTIWGSSSSSGTTTTFTYSKTISQTSQDFSELKTIQTSSFSGGGLATKEKVTFKLGNDEHYIGIRTLTTSSATVEIASTPTQVSLVVGQTIKRDLNNDGFYDVSIKLNGITNGKADLTISYLHEEPPAGTTTSETGEQTTGTTPSASNMPWTWIIVGIIVLVIVVGGGFALKKKKKR